MARPQFQLSVDARLIFERLIAAKVGDEIQYTELSGLVGIDVQYRSRHILVSAIHKALYDRRMVFASIRNVGVTRLKDDDIIASSEGDLRRIRRVSRRSIRKLAAVEFDKLSNESKIKQNAFMSMMGALTSFASQPNIKRIEAHVTTAHQALPLAKTLEAFAKA